MEVKVKWVFIESQITERIGHYFNYIKSLANLVEGEVVYVPKSCGIDDPSFIRFFLPYTPPVVGRIKIVNKLRSLAYQCRMTFQRYKELEFILEAQNRLSKPGIIVWLTLDDFELVSFLLVKVPRNLLLFGIVHMKPQSFYTKIAVRVLSLFKLFSLNRKVLGYNTKGIKNQVESMGVKTRGVILPYPFRQPEQNTGQKERCFISYLGDARKEKGFDLLLDNIVALSNRSEVFIQCNLPARPEMDLVNKLKSIRGIIAGNNSIYWHDRILTTEEYDRIIKCSKLIVLPYDITRYQDRVSGILGEALISGVPVVVSPNTWLAEQVARFGGGVVMEDYSSTGLLKAVDIVLNDLASYKKQAAIAGQKLYEENNPEKVLKTISDIASNFAFWDFFTNVRTE